MLTYEEASKDEGRQEQHTRSPLKSPIMKSPLPIPVAEKTSVPCRSTEPRTRTQRRIARMAAGKEPQPPQLNNERPMIEDTPPPSDHSFDDPPDAHAVDVRAVISSTVDRVPTTSITQPGTALSHYCSKRDSGIRTPPQTPPRPYLTSVAGTRIPRPTHGVPSNKTLTIALPPYLGGEDEHSSPTESHLAGSTVTSTPNTVNVAPYRQHDRLPHSLDSLMPVSEATSSLCLLALNLDYDLIYLLRVRSLGSPNYGGDQQSIATQLLFSRGMPDPCPAFNAPLHLQALKSAGGLIYENREQDLSHDPIVFTSGLITPIVRDDPPSTAVHEGQSIPSCEGVGNFPADEDCMGGVVLAVFKKQPGGRDDFSPDVVDSIARAGHALKTLLVDAR